MGGMSSIALRLALEDILEGLRSVIIGEVIIGFCQRSIRRSHLAAHLVVEPGTAAALFLEHGGGLFYIGREAERIAHAYLASHLLHILVGTDVGEGPTHLTEFLDERLNLATVPGERRILIAIGDDGDEHAVAMADPLQELADAGAHGVVEGCASEQRIVGACDVAGFGDGLGRIDAVEEIIAGTERCQRDILLQLGVGLLRPADGSKGLVYACECLVVNDFHRA